MKKTLFLLSIILLILGCNGEETISEEDGAVVTITVRNLQGSIISGETVYYVNKSSGELVAQGTTNEDGENIQELKPGFYLTSTVSPDEYNYTKIYENRDEDGAVDIISVYLKEDDEKSYRLEKDNAYCGDGICNEDCSTCPSDCQSDYRVCCNGEWLLGDCCTDDDCNERYACEDNDCVYQNPCDGGVHSCCGENMINLFDDSENRMSDGTLKEDIVIIMNYSTNGTMTLYYNGYTKEISEPGVFRGEVYNMLSVSQPEAGGLWFCFRKTSIGEDEELVKINNPVIIEDKNIILKSENELIINGEEGIIDELGVLNNTVVEFKDLIKSKEDELEAAIISITSLTNNDYFLREGDSATGLVNNSVSLTSIDTNNQLTINLNGEEEVITKSQSYSGNASVSLLNIYDSAAVLRIIE